MRLTTFGTAFLIVLGAMVMVTAIRRWLVPQRSEIIELESPGSQPPLPPPGRAARFVDWTLGGVARVLRLVLYAMLFIMAIRWGISYLDQMI